MGAQHRGDVALPGEEAAIGVEPVAQALPGAEQHFVGDLDAVLARDEQAHIHQRVEQRPHWRRHRVQRQRPADEAAAFVAQPRHAREGMAQLLPRQRRGLLHGEGSLGAATAGKRVSASRALRVVPKAGALAGTQRTSLSASASTSAGPASAGSQTIQSAVRRRSRGSAPAGTTEDLPLPEAPTTQTSRASETRARASVPISSRVSSSRPKKIAASASSKASVPGYSARPPFQAKRSSPTAAAGANASRRQVASSCGGAFRSTMACVSPSSDGSGACATCTATMLRRRARASASSAKHHFEPLLCSLHRYSTASQPARRQ